MARQIVASGLILPAALFAIGEAKVGSEGSSDEFYSKVLRLAASRSFGAPARLFQPRGLWYEGRVDRRKNFSRRSQKEKQ